MAPGFQRFGRDMLFANSNCLLESSKGSTPDAKNLSLWNPCNLTYSWAISDSMSITLPHTYTAWSVRDFRSVAGRRKFQ